MNRYHITKHSPKRKNKNKITVCVKLPSDVQAARHGCKGAFNFWKQQNFSDNGEVHDVYRPKRREYRKHLRKFLNQIEIDKAAKLCNAAQSNEKLFWKLIKNQKSSSQMSAFLIDGKMITDKNDIREMWAEHFEKLGTPSTNTNFNSVFLDRVIASVQEFMTSCKNDSFGDLNDPLRYEEVANVCSKLKPGASGVVTDYEHVRFAGPVLWNFLFELYNEFFDRSSVCESLKVGTILPLFKGKGVKANNKDNYWGITLFPTLCKIYEMVLLNRLEKYAERRGFFRICNLVFRKVSDVSRPPSLYSRQSIICLNEEVKSSAAFLMFAKHLTRFGLTGCFSSYLRNWVSTVECGLQLKTCTRM